MVFDGLILTEFHSLYKCNFESAGLGIARGADPVKKNKSYKGCASLFLQFQKLVDVR
jgi:hypothetical protein